jgi:hypothetical protein
VHVQTKLSTIAPIVQHFSLLPHSILFSDPDKRRCST